MTDRSLRRIVTGDDGGGRSVVQEDGPVGRRVLIGGELESVFHEVFHT